MTVAIADHHSQPKDVVLCIDDDMQMLNVLEAFLTNSGFRVLTASTPESTLMLFLNNHVDTVVTDYEIGDVTGEDVIRSLRSLWPGIPVVLFSSAECLPNKVLTLADRSVHNANWNASCKTCEAAGKGLKQWLDRVGGVLLFLVRCGLSAREFLYLVEEDPELTEKHAPFIEA